MKIPKKFMCFGHWVDVVYDPELMKKSGILGFMSFEENLICLQPNCEGMGISETQVQETYLHEKAHYILMAIGRSDLSEDENFVNLFSRVEYQILETSVYGDTG